MLKKYFAINADWPCLRKLTVAVVRALQVIAVLCMVVPMWIFILPAIWLRTMWLRNNALIKNADAAAKLGDDYYESSLDRLLGGIPSDRPNALKWYRKAVELGDSKLRRQQSRLQRIKAQEAWRFTDDDELNCYAAERGNDSARRRLMYPEYYSRYNGVPLEYRNAFFWTCRRAIRGDLEAQNHLGAMYSMGKGTRQNDALAVKWYRKAAEAGSPEAQFNLGHMYEWGLGIERDYAKAVYWYRRAADVLARAQAALAEMHAKGQGVRQNYFEAYKWAGLAEAHGYTAIRRKDLRRELTPRQIEEAKKWIARWNPFDVLAE